MKIETGSPAGEIRYWLILTLALVAFGGWFIYDGAAGYPKKNAREAEKFFAGHAQGGAKPVDVSKLGEVPDKPDFDAMLRKAPRRTEELRAAWGEPVVTERNAEGSTVEYYASRYGVVTAVSSNGRIAARPAEGGAFQPVISWRVWSKTKADIQAQYYWGLIPLAMAIWPGRRLVRALTLRVTLDEEALDYGGQRIPVAAMTGLRDYDPKGWVDLYYNDGGGERMLRLDNQKVAAFDKIVEAICAARGFENPLRAAGATGSADAAGEPAEDDERGRKAEETG